MADDRRKPPPNARQERLAAALRQNLAKRKAQARSRAGETPPKRDKTPSSAPGGA
jgi:hypothetical protein